MPEPVLRSVRSMRSRSAAEAAIALSKDPDSRWDDPVEGDFLQPPPREPVSRDKDSLDEEAQARVRPGSRLTAK
jgi:hypothetical protein